MKPVLFCDVDGVVNVPKGSHDNLIETPFKKLEGLPKLFNYKTFRHRPEVEKFIKTIETDFVWLTAWQKFAPVSLDKLFQRETNGYLPWEHNFIKWFTDRKHFNKSVALNSWVEMNPKKPFVWIDDYAVQFANKYDFSKREDVLIIRPETHVGLTDEHIMKIKHFTKKF